MDNKSKKTPQKNDNIELVGLKTVATLLETQISVLSFRKAQLYQLIHQFGIKYNEAVGEIVFEILDIRRKLLFDEKDQNPDKNTEYNEAEQDYINFKKQYISNKNEPKFQLNDDDKKLLQKLFRNASKLCHPDIIADEMKSQAAEVFVKLNQAYLNNDLETLKKLYQLLKNNELHFAHITEEITEIKRFEQIIAKLEQEVKALKEEIFQIEHSDAYLTIKDIDNWDEYFQKIKVKLTEDLNRLKLEYESK